jgi:hypothetical protein
LKGRPFYGIIKRKISARLLGQSGESPGSRFDGFQDLFFYMRDNADTDPENIQALHRAPRDANLRVAHAESLGVSASTIASVQGSSPGGIGGSTGMASSVQTTNQVVVSSGGTTDTGSGGTTDTGSDALNAKLDQLNNPIL